VLDTDAYVETVAPLAQDEGEIGRRAETISEDTSAPDTATTEVDSANADSTPNAATDKTDSTDNADPQAVSAEID
jgi:hypothetical protein